jgi:phosphatidylglycerophosphatase A
MKNPLLVWFQRSLASVLFLGYIPFASGTIGSAVMAAALWWFVCVKHLAVTPLQFWAASLAFSAFAVLVSARPREVFGEDDPSAVIIDECAGQLISFLFVPLSLKTIILGFFLFRFFDIVKPFPVHNMESLEGGLGVVMDDVAAGVLTNISLLSILFGYHFVKSLL